MTDSFGNNLAVKDMILFAVGASMIPAVITNVTENAINPDRSYITVKYPTGKRSGAWRAGVEVKKKYALRSASLQQYQSFIKIHPSQICKFKMSKPYWIKQEADVEQQSNEMMFQLMELMK